MVVCAFWALAIFPPSPASADECAKLRSIRGRAFDWCAEVGDFAVAIRQAIPVEKITSDDSLADALAAMPEASRWLLTYAYQHPGERCYGAWIRPQSELRDIKIAFEVGVVLKGGETLWARWLTNGAPHEVPFSLLRASTQTNATGRYFLALLSFPRRAASGDDWSDNDVTDLRLLSP
jgi:hypothetical protein